MQPSTKTALLLRDTKGPVYSNQVLYDDFLGVSKPLNDRSPKKGNGKWIVTGTGELAMQAGNGVCSMPNGSGLAGYFYQNFDQIPGKMTCHWTQPTGNIATPPTMSIVTGTNVAVDNGVHGEMTTTNFLVRLLTAGPVFTMPAFWVKGSDWSLSSGKNYYTEFYLDGKWAQMILKDDANTQVGKMTVYDPAFVNYTTKTGFWQFLDEKINYQDVALEYKPTAGYSFWPSLNVLKETTFPSNADGFVSDPYFGGTVTWNSAGSVTIQGYSYPEGGALTLGNLTAGDKVWVSLDSTAHTGTGSGDMIFSIVSGYTPIAEQQPIATSPGRYQFTFTVTSTVTDARLLILPGAGAPANSSITISGVNIYLNPPTTP